jgi:hypothetical protein
VGLLSGRGEAGALAGEALQGLRGGLDHRARSAFMAQNFSEGFFLEAVRAGEDLAEPFIDADDIADVAVAP